MQHGKGNGTMIVQLVIQPEEWPRLRDLLRSGFGPEEVVLIGQAPADPRTAAGGGLMLLEAQEETLWRQRLDELMNKRQKMRITDGVRAYADRPAIVAIVDTPYAARISEQAAAAMRAEVDDALKRVQARRQ